MISQRLSVMFRVSFNLKVGQYYILMLRNGSVFPRIGYLPAKHLVHRSRPSLSDDAPPHGAVPVVSSSVDRTEMPG
jgi:hypothetical protein